MRTASSTSRRARVTAMVLTAGLLIAGCGSDDDQGSNALNTKPDVTVPDSPPPSTLEVTDLTVGEGEEATSGKQVTVQYVGKSWSNKEQFDASWDRGEPFSFGLGRGDVITGWDEGVQGMKEGGRRQIVIPPEMGYGASGAGGVIGPNETLVFVVDLVSVDN